MGWLAGDVAMITGGGSGLGRALVARFIAEGAKISVLEFSPDKAAALQRDFGDDLVVTVGDVRSMEANNSTVKAAVERFGKLDILVGNAGILDNPMMLLDTPEDKVGDAFDEVMGVNVKGYILAARAAAPELIKTKGCMVFTASIASFAPGGAGVFYTTSKHAVVGVVRELAYQLAPDVRVNAVAPGPMRTDLRGSAVLGKSETVFSGETNQARVAARFPLSCMEPDDYTGMFVALASRGNAATTTGEIVNAGDGLAIRGIVSISGAWVRSGQG